MNRAEEIALFLEGAGWKDALPENMEADFSSRRFTRLHHKDKDATAILMDADEDQKTSTFVVLAWLLRGLNLSTPEIYAEQRQRGLVLMEDFGEGNVGRLMDSGYHEIEPFYHRAATVLAHLHQNFVPTTVNDLKLPRFTSALFAKQAEKFLDGYMPFALKRVATDNERRNFHAAWTEVLRPVDALPQTLILRDFMPDNVMDLPERKNWQSFGILDFQDAGIGPIAYDLASFCEVVRRGGGDIYLQRVMKDYFDRCKPACPWDVLLRSGFILAAQRHVRILGILGNIAQKDPNSKKLVYLPRVQDYVKYLLKDEALRPVSVWMSSAGLLT